MNKVGYVYSTTNYEMFKKLEGNRDVFEQRKRVIRESICENGWIRNPVVINEKMEIIDGQGRFEALKELEMPIEYVIAEGADVNTCIALNVKQKNWTKMDYVKCYSELGCEEYVLFEKLLEEYKDDLSFDVMRIICNGYKTDNNKSDLILTGKFVISDKETIRARLQFIAGIMSLLGKEFGRKREWAIISNFVFYCPAINNRKFVNKLEKYPMFLAPCVTTRQVLECFEKIYNYNDKKDERVYFVPEYEKWKRKMK